PLPILTKRLRGSKRRTTTSNNPLARVSDFGIMTTNDHRGPINDIFFNLIRRYEGTNANNAVGGLMDLADDYIRFLSVNGVDFRDKVHTGADNIVEVGPEGDVNYIP